MARAMFFCNNCGERLNIPGSGYIMRRQPQRGRGYYLYYFCNQGCHDFYVRQRDLPEGGVITTHINESTTSSTVYITSDYITISFASNNSTWRVIDDVTTPVRTLDSTTDTHYVRTRREPYITWADSGYRLADIFPTVSINATEPPHRVAPVMDHDPEF